MAIDPNRHSRTMAALSISTHDVLVCASVTEVLLLTGYSSAMAHSIAVFSANGGAKVIGPEDEAELAAKISSAGIVPYKPEGIHPLHTPIAHPKAPRRSPLKHLSTSTMTNRRCAGSSRLRRPGAKVLLV